MHIINENFEKDVLNSEIPVLVDFFASWCGPCKMMSPIIEEIQREMEGKIKVYKIDTDKEQNLAIEYGIMSIPTFIVFKDGKISAKVIGMKTKEELIKLINK